VGIFAEDNGSVTLVSLCVGIGRGCRNALVITFPANSTFPTSVRAQEEFLEANMKVAPGPTHDEGGLWSGTFRPTFVPVPFLMASKMACAGRNETPREVLRSRAEEQASIRRALELFGASGGDDGGPATGDEADAFALWCASGPTRRFVEALGRLQAAWAAAPIRCLDPALEPGPHRERRAPHGWACC
jgi:hypothetical protein